MIPDKAKLYAKLEAAGETKVRENLAQGVYGGAKENLVHEWLRQQGAVRESQQRESQAQRGERSLTLAKDANDLAEEANDISRQANDTASKAYRMAALSAIIASLAVIVTVVTQCTSDA